MSERTHISLEDWAKLSAPSSEYIGKVVDMLTEENELMKLFPYEPREPDPWYTRTRNAIGHWFVNLGFHIAPDIRDDYY